MAEAGEASKRTTGPLNVRPRRSTRGAASRAALRPRAAVALGVPSSGGPVRRRLLRLPFRRDASQRRRGAPPPRRRLVGRVGPVRTGPAGHVRGHPANSRGPRGRATLLRPVLPPEARPGIVPRHEGAGGRLDPGGRSTLPSRASQASRSWSTWSRWSGELSSPTFPRRWSCSLPSSLSSE